MALGKSQGNNNTKLSILKIKVKDENLKPVDPYFQVTEKIDGKWTVVSSSENFVSGKITSVAHKVSTYENEDYDSFTIFLEDGDDAFLLDLRPTMLNRSLINSLLSLTDLETPVSIQLYTSKNGYPSVALRQNDELIKWKYSLDEQPKPITVMFKGKEQRDYTPIDKFFVEKVTEFGGNFKGQAGKQSAAPAKANTAAEQEEIAPDDIPF